MEQAVLQQRAELRTPAAFTLGRLPEPPAVAGAAASLPAALRRERSAPFVGRTAELDGLAQEMRASGQPRTRVVLISGEPGIGKTRVLAEAARGAAGAGLIVLYGAASETDRLPFLPFVHAVTQLGAADPDAVGSRAEALAPVLERSRELADGVLARHRLFTAVTETLAAARSRVLLIVDDAHWADEGTLALARHLGAADLDLVLVLAYRHTELLDGHPLEATLAALSRHGAPAHLALGGLGAAQIAQLVAGRAAEPGRRVDGAALAAATAGNPSYALQLVDAGAVPGQHPLPPGLRGVLVDRATRLGADVAQFLRVGAVLGRRFDVAVAAATGGYGPDEALTLGERATRAGLLHDHGGTFEFVHELVARALLDTVGESRRQSMRRTAERLAARADPASPARRANAPAVATTGAGRPDMVPMLP